MKIIIIGLGSYGSVLAVELTKLGHQVIGADEKEQNIEEIKDQITTSLCVNTADKINLSLLPITEVDLIVVAIGNNFSSSVKTVALLKELNAKRIYARAINEIHKSVLSALGVDKILSPEIESAILTSKIIDFQTVEDSFIIDKDYYIVKFSIPKKITGIKLSDLELEQNHHITPIALTEPASNLIATSKYQEQVIEPTKAQNTILTPQHKLVAYGKQSDFQSLWRALK